MNWISVKERLPQPDREVLFFDARFENIEMGSINPEGTKWHPTWAVTLYDADYVTHWMPLPKSPENEWHYVHVYHSFSGELVVDCEREFSVISHYCTPCKFYGVCVTKEFPVF